MHSTWLSLSEEQVSAVLVVASVVVALTWATTSLDGVSRIVTAGLAGAVATATMTVGLE